MKFTVVWMPNAEEKLLRLWMRASDRQPVTDAANRIDKQLCHNAHELGESRTADRRIFHEPPLGVIFSVDKSDRMVRVLDIWRYAP